MGKYSILIFKSAVIKEILRKTERDTFTKVRTKKGGMNTGSNAQII